MSVHRFVLVDINKDEDRYSVLDEFDGVIEDYTYSALRDAIASSRSKDGVQSLFIAGTCLLKNGILHTWVRHAFSTESLDLFIKSVVADASVYGDWESPEKSYAELLPSRVNVWYDALYAYFNDELKQRDQGVSDRTSRLSAYQIKILREALMLMQDYSLLTFRATGFKVRLVTREVNGSFKHCVDLVKYEPLSRLDTMNVVIPSWITGFRADAFADLEMTTLYASYSAGMCDSLADMFTNTKCKKLYLTITDLPDTVYDASSMFYNSRAEVISIKGSSFTHITNAKCMFKYCDYVTSIIFPKSNKHETFKYMTLEGFEGCFDSCSDLKSIDFGYGLGNKLLPTWDIASPDAPFYCCRELDTIKVEKAGKWARFLPNTVLVEAKWDAYDGVLLSQYSDLTSKDREELVQRFITVHRDEFEFNWSSGSGDVTLVRYNGKSKFVAIPRFVSGIATSFEEVGKESSPFSETKQSLYVDTMIFAPAMFAGYKGKSIELRTKLALKRSGVLDWQVLSLRCLCANAKNLQTFNFVSGAELQLANDYRSMFEGCTSLKALNDQSMGYDVEVYPDCTVKYSDTESARSEYSRSEYSWSDDDDFGSLLYKKLSMSKRFDGIFKDCVSLEEFRMFSQDHVGHICSWRRAFENCRKLSKIVLTYAVVSYFNEATSYEGMLFNCPAKIVPYAGYGEGDFDLSLPDNAYTAPVKGNMIKFDKYNKKLGMLGMQYRYPFILDFDKRLDGVSLIDVMAWDDVDLNGRIDFPEFITDIVGRPREVLPVHRRQVGKTLEKGATLTVTWKKCLPVAFTGLMIGDSDFWFNRITVVYDIDVSNIRNLGTTLFSSNAVAKLHRSFAKFGLTEIATNFAYSGLGTCQYEFM